MPGEQIPEIAVRPQQLAVTETSHALQDKGFTAPRHFVMHITCLSLANGAMIQLSGLWLMQRDTRHILRKTIAGFMAVWLSGFVFLFCCYASSAMTHATEFCPMHTASHHCDGNMEQNDASNAVGRFEGVCFDCCGYLPAVFDKARKVDQSAPVTAPERVAVTPRLITPRPIRATPVPAYRTRLADKSRTFISTQVFRI